MKLQSAYNSLVVSKLTRALLKIEIKETKKRRALEMYQNGKCTLWKAAQLADIPLREMMELAEENRIPLHISPEDVDEAWTFVLQEYALLNTPRNNGQRILHAWRPREKTSH